MHANLRGTRYKFSAKKLPADTGGSCSSPQESNPAIDICSTIKREDIFLENIIHEMLHGCYWDLDEAAITEGARDIAKVLRKLGVKVDVAEAKKTMNG
jgi:hypothetical protein